MIADFQLEYYWDMYKNYKVKSYIPTGAIEEISIIDLYRKWARHMAFNDEDKTPHAIEQNALKYFKEYFEDGMLKLSGPGGELSYLCYAAMRIQTYYYYRYYDESNPFSSNVPYFEILSENGSIKRRIPKERWNFWVKAMGY